MNTKPSNEPLMEDEDERVWFACVERGLLNFNKLVNKLEDPEDFITHQKMIAEFVLMQYEIFDLQQRIADLES